MVYTKARLEDALRVFRHSPKCCKEHVLPSDKLNRRLRSQYGTRKAAKITPLVNVNVWHANFGDSGSDDEEYDPRQERRRPAARSSKKKRKLDDIADSDGVGEREAKKMKGDTSSLNHRSDCTFLTLKLTSDKGIQLLQDIDALGHVLRIGQSSSGAVSSKEQQRGPSSYFDRYLSTDAVRDRKLAELLDKGLLEMDVDVDVDDEYISNKHKVLRNGKVVEKARQRRKKPSKGKSRPSAPSSCDEHGQASVVTKTASHKSAPHTNRVHLNTPPVTKGSTHSTSKRINLAVEGSSANNPIDLDSDSNDIATPPYRAQGRSSQPQNENVATNSTIKHETALPPSPISLPDPTSNSPSPLPSSTVLTISTAFAHPLVFIPSTTSPAIARLQCHFCTDPRMSIIGHGRRQVEVFVDPDNPLVYQEMGGGFRGEGLESTTICFACVRTRIQMMRCHLKGKPSETKKQSHSTEDGDNENSGFERMRVRKLIGSLSANIAYQKWLFSRNANRDTDNCTEAPLQSCSLCPMPAGWVCCKKDRQATGFTTMRTPFSTPYVISTNRAFDSPQSLRPMSQYGRASTSEIPKDTDVIMIDSDSEAEPSANMSKKVLEQRQEQKRLRHIAGSPSSVRPSSSVTPALSSIDGTEQLSRGCGLKLCENCKILVVNRCRGALDKRVLTARFNAAFEDGQVSGRADVEFLFQGSVAHIFYEQEIRKRAGKAKHQEWYDVWD